MRIIPHLLVSMKADQFQRWMLPIAQTLVTLLARLPLLFIIDGSTVGRGCMCLMLSVVYYRRALPLGCVR